MPAQVQNVNGAGSVGGVGTGAGCVGQVRSRCGFDMARVRDACARTRSYLIFCWSVD